jgi:LacI family transcriptional regulator
MAPRKSIPPNAVRPATLKTVAERSGTSVTTVSRVLNGIAREHNIPDATSQRVRLAAAALNFSPDPVARGLRLRKTGTIGVIVPDIANHFFASVVKAISVAADAVGRSILLCDSMEDTEKEIKVLDVLLRRRVDGLLLAPVGQACGHLKDLESSASVPTVLVDRWFPELTVPHVGSDNVQGSRDAIEYLITLGHRRIAFLAGHAASKPDEDRRAGYRDALRHHGIPYDPNLVVPDPDLHHPGRGGIRELLSRTRDFTAVFAVSSHIGIGAFEALRVAGIRVPDDVSLLNFDEQPYSRLLAVPMTTVEHDHREIGRLALEMLCERINRPSAAIPESVLVPTRLVPRASVRALVS